MNSLDCELFFGLSIDRLVNPTEATGDTEQLLKMVLFLNIALISTFEHGVVALLTESKWITGLLLIFCLFHVCLLIIFKVPRRNYILN